VERRVRGREHWLRLQARPLRDAANWLAHYRAFWDTRLDALEALLLRQQRQAAAAKARRRARTGQ
jgi:hypothetical protein